MPKCKYTFRQHVINGQECDTCLIYLEPDGTYWKHGSKSSYNRHIRVGKEPCEPCKKAYRAYLDERRVPLDISPEEIRQRSEKIWQDYLHTYKVTSQYATFNFDSSMDRRMPMNY